MSPQAARLDGGALRHVQRANPLAFKIASSVAEFEAIYRLNHATFAVEIPQHATNPHGRLVDAYHPENTYMICLCGDIVVGMVAGRCSRPFSLDRKVADLDLYLPPHRKAVEIRLLAVTPRYRHSTVFTGLVSRIARYFLDRECDLALISGTLRQLKLYRHMEFRPFADPIGDAGAGAATALLGLLLQETMGIIIAAIYVLAGRRWVALLRNWVPWGVIYGAVIFVVMFGLIVAFFARHTGQRAPAAGELAA